MKKPSGLRYILLTDTKALWLLMLGLLLCLIISLSGLYYPIENQILDWLVPFTSVLWLGGALWFIKRNILLLIPAIWLVFLFPFYTSSFETSGVPGDIELIDFLEHHRVLGASVGVLYQGKAYFAGYGKISKFGDSPDSQTVYPAGHLTMAFTGHIYSERFNDNDLDYAVHRTLLPDLAKDPNFRWQLMLNGNDLHRTLDAMDWFNVIEETRQIKPSSSPKFNPLNYCLLGKPLGLSNQMFQRSVSYSQPEEVAIGLSAMGLAIEPPPPNKCRGATGLYTNAEDLLSFTTIESNAKKIYASVEEQAFGLGWQFKDGIWFAYNQMRGYSGFIGHQPDKDFAIVILINGETMGLKDFALDYMHQFDARLRKMQEAQQEEK